MLNGKANNDFLDWIVNKYFFKGSKYNNLNIYQKGDLEVFLRFKTTKQAYIVEWLDTQLLAISINTEYYDGFIFGWSINADKPQKSKILFESRQEALESAIKTASKIYNQKHNDII